MRRMVSEASECQEWGSRSLSLPGLHGGKVGTSVNDEDLRRVWDKVATPWDWGSVVWSVTDEDLTRFLKKPVNSGSAVSSRLSSAGLLKLCSPFSKTNIGWAMTYFSCCCRSSCTCSWRVHELVNRWLSSFLCVVDMVPTIWLWLGDH